MKLKKLYELQKRLAEEAFVIRTKDLSRTEDHDLMNDESNEIVNTAANIENSEN